MPAGLPARVPLRHPCLRGTSLHCDKITLQILGVFLVLFFLCASYCITLTSKNYFQSFRSKRAHRFGRRYAFVSTIIEESSKFAEIVVLTSFLRILMQFYYKNLVTTYYFPPSFSRLPTSYCPKIWLHHQLNPPPSSLHLHPARSEELFLEISK